MKREIETKFYTFSQNNSGGYFIENDDVATYLIIEAQSEEEAVSKMQNITAEYSDFCICCGERWSDYAIDSGTEKPLVFGKDVKKDNPVRSDSSSTIIHYYDGTKEKLWYK